MIQMSFLRLMTTEAAMGVDVLTLRDAWRLYRKMMTGDRVVFLTGPDDFETEWFRLTGGNRSSPKVWADAYFAAFAHAGGNASGDSGPSHAWPCQQSIVATSYRMNIR